MIFGGLVEGCFFYDFLTQKSSMGWPVLLQELHLPQDYRLLCIFAMILLSVFCFKFLCLY